MAGRRCRRWAPAVLLATLAATLVPAGAAAADDLEEPKSKRKPPAGFELSAREVTRIARGTPQVQAERRAHPSLSPTAYTNGPGKWQVSWSADDDELAQVHVDDATGSVTEAWTGPQVAWKMARGYEGAFGRTLNAPYVWIPLCVLFLLPFVDPRRPFRLLHLDLLVLIGFGASHYFFNRGEISVSVPLVYPVLLYLLARMSVAGFRPRERRERLIPLVPATWLVLGIVFLVGFRVAMNVADSNVIDVGYAGVIGADKIMDGEGIYDGDFPESNARGDTYGPATYLTYVPFEQALPWSGAWDELAAAHAAAIAFDLLTLGGLFLVGRRLRAGREGRELGLALAFAWASYPYAMFALCTNSNDTLVAMLLVYALLAVTSAPARGALVGLAAAAKFAPAALAPLFLRGTGDAPGGRRLRPVLLFVVAFSAVVAGLALAFMPEGGLRELFDRTVGYQAARDAPFSIWGQQPSLGWLQTAVKAGAVVLALAVAFVPRRRTPAQVAALGAAVLIAVELTATYWFYLYIVWFAPFVLVALFAAYRGAEPAIAVRPDEPERRRQPSGQPVPA